MIPIEKNKGFKVNKLSFQLIKFVNKIKPKKKTKKDNKEQNLIKLKWIIQESIKNVRNWYNKKGVKQTSRQSNQERKGTNEQC